MADIVKSAVRTSLKPITALLKPNVPDPVAPPAEQKVTPLPDEDELTKAARKRAAGRVGSRRATTALSGIAGGTGGGGDRLGP